jgi:hypothetical protein
MIANDEAEFLIKATFRNLISRSDMTSTLLRKDFRLSASLIWLPQFKWPSKRFAPNKLHNPVKRVI